MSDELIRVLPIIIGVVIFVGIGLFVLRAVEREENDKT